MNEREIANKNRILETVTGSFLYGTNTPTSDKDYVGVFLPTEEYILGFKRCEEVDFSVVDKNAAGKNTEKALDRKLYEFRKFIKLALDNNPNILEILFTNDQNCTFLSVEGAELLKIRHLFPWYGLKQKFLGYAFAQKHKMAIKKGNYFDLQEALVYLERFEIRKTLLEVMLEIKNSCPPFICPIRSKQNHLEAIHVGDLSFNPNATVKFAKKALTERLGKVGNREELYLKYGFDVKFGMHLVRLMLEGIELLKTGELKFPLKEADMLLDIRNGKWGVEKILKFSEELEKEMESIPTKLPKSPKIDELEKFTIKMLRGVIK